MNFPAKAAGDREKFLATSGSLGKAAGAAFITLNQVVPPSSQSKS
jgi:hypothetical protein